MVADLVWRHYFLVILIDDDFEMERDFFNNTLVKILQIFDSIISVHEEVGHRIFIICLNSPRHFLSKAWESHRNHEVVFNLETCDGAVIPACDRS